MSIHQLRYLPIFSVKTLSLKYTTNRCILGRGQDGVYSGVPLRTVPARMGSAQPRAGAEGVPALQEPLLGSPAPDGYRWFPGEAEAVVDRDGARANRT